MVYLFGDIHGYPDELFNRLEEANVKPGDTVVLLGDVGLNYRIGNSEDYHNKDKMEQTGSENVKWRVRNNFKSGIPWNARLLGYRMENGKYEIVPEEAETVRRIFDLYLSGMGPLKISKTLNNEGRQTREHYPWRPNGVCAVLRNDTYTGNLTLQKTYRELLLDFL